MTDRAPRLPDSRLHPVVAPCGRRFAEELLSGYLDGRSPRATSSGCGYPSRTAPSAAPA